MALSWLLDDGVVDLLARTGSSSWPALRSEDLAVAEATAVDGKDERRRLLDAEVVRVLPVRAESPAEALLYGYFRSRSEYRKGATINFAEHQALALLMTSETTRTFVTFDKSAAYLALMELGPGRVAHPFDLWQYLERRGCLPAGFFAELVEGSRRKEQLGPPWRFGRP